VTPRIDKRTYADHLALLLSQPVRVGGVDYANLVGRFLPEWNPDRDAADDFGVAQLKLFARLMELLGERLNRVPEKHFTAFLDLLGVERRPGSPARAPVTFNPAPKTTTAPFVPAGVQVATTQTETRPAIVFETETGFNLTPVQLTHLLTVDPAADRYRDLRAELAKEGADSVTVLAVDAPTAENLVEHSLYIAHEQLFALKTQPDLTLRIELAQPGSLGTMNVVWERYDGKQWAPVVPAPGNGAAWLSSAGPVDVVLSAFPGTESCKVNGTPGRWLRVRLIDPLTAGASALPAIGRIRVAARPPDGRSLTAERAFHNTFPIDLNQDFFPFGPRPAGNDAFYLTATEALNNPEPAVTRRITVHINLAPLPGRTGAARFPDPARNPQVTWEYWSATHKRWQALSTHLVDGTAHFTSQAAATVVFDLPSDIGPVMVNGVEASWIRARLTQGDYGLPASSDVQVTVDPATGVSTLVRFDFQPESYRPPLFAMADFRIEYASTGDDFVDLTACQSANYFHFADHAPGHSFRPFRTLGELGETNPALYLGYDNRCGNRTLGELGETNPALYLGNCFGNVHISQLLRLAAPDPRLLLGETGARQPRIAWEYVGATGGWRSLNVQDGTRALSSTGTLAFTAPLDLAASVQFGQKAWWLRARLAAGELQAPRRLRAVHLNTVWTQSLRTVREERLGSGSGETPQTVRLAQRPVLYGECIRVREDDVPSEAALAELNATEQALARKLGAAPQPVVATRRNALSGEDEFWVRWYPVSNFRFSSPNSRHYTIDRASGEITFGARPAPLARDNILAESYRAGFEADANVGVGQIKQLKSSLPFVAGVVNPQEAAGWAAAERPNDTLARGPLTLKHRDRAVTREDFDALAREASSEVALVRTLPISNPLGQRELGAVTVLIVPHSAEREPQPSPELLDRVRTYLTQRMATTAAHRLYVIGPRYQVAAVTARVVPADPAEASVITARVAAALEAFLHPLSGGWDGTGWSFDRDVHIAEIYAVIEAVDGVDHAIHAGFTGGPDPAVVVVGANELVRSGIHTIEALAADPAPAPGTP
jgi:hypothetical protein